MTNFERIKGFTLPEMAEFLKELVETVAYDIENEVCEHCFALYGNCPYEETQSPNNCRFVDRTKTLERWLNKSPNP